MPILSSAPHLGDYSPAFRIHRVTFKSGTSETLSSVAGIKSAESAGKVAVRQTDIVVNTRGEVAGRGTPA